GTNHQNSAAEFTLSPEEIQCLFKAARSTRNELLVQVLYYGGIRRQELCDLDVPDIQWDRERVVIRSGKGGKSRTVLLPVSVLYDLKKHLGRRRVGPVFQSERKGKRLSVRGVNHIVATIGERAGVSNPNPRLVNVNPHLLRHSFARHYLAKGGDIRKLSQLLGHANVAITHAVYGTASEEEMMGEYRRLMGD
ncbi:tyrosine-type recombinase/integrase, partial [Candidatus Bipolaricaulota bacterium]|nr:tyrosine-type recombinase/integrase [Candidatus Bipolaricaulota bacterium]